MRLKALFGLKGKKVDTQEPDAPSVSQAFGYDDNEAPSQVSSSMFFSSTRQIGGHRRPVYESAGPPLPSLPRRPVVAEFSTRMQSGDDTLGHAPRRHGSKRLTPPDKPSTDPDTMDSDEARSGAGASPPESPRLLEAGPERRRDRETDAPVLRALHHPQVALLPRSGRASHIEDALPWFNDGNMGSTEASEKVVPRPLVLAKPQRSREKDADEDGVSFVAHEHQQSQLEQVQHGEGFLAGASDTHRAASAAESEDRAEAKTNVSQRSVSNDSDAVILPQSNAGLLVSDLASLSFPSASLSFLIHGMSVDHINSLTSSYSRQGDGVREIVESAYADAIQEETRGPGGGLRRIVELLRQSEDNRMAVENIAIAIAVLSENDAVASSAFGNHNALGALVYCLCKYDTVADVVVTKRVVAALRVLVGASRRNSKLLGQESVFRITATGASSVFVGEPSIAEDSLQIVAIKMMSESDSKLTTSSRVFARRGSKQLHPARHSLSALFSSVQSTMCLHPARAEVQVAGMLVLRTVLAQPGRGSLSTAARMDMLEVVCSAFRAHGARDTAVAWLTLALFCDAQLVGDAHACARVELGCFFASLRLAVGAAGAGGAGGGTALVARALHMSAPIGWRGGDVPQQAAVYNAAVGVCLDVLRVFRTSPDVLEAVVGLVHGLCDAEGAREFFEDSKLEFGDDILSAICEMTQG